MPQIPELFPAILSDIDDLDVLVGEDIKGTGKTFKYSFQVLKEYFGANGGTGVISIVTKTGTKLTGDVLLTTGDITITSNFNFVTDADLVSLERFEVVGDTLNILDENGVTVQSIDNNLVTFEQAVALNSVEDGDWSMEMLLIDPTTKKIKKTSVLVDHGELTSIGIKTHDEIDTHIDDDSIHFTEDNISHLNIKHIGTNTHEEIDAFIIAAASHVTAANPFSVNNRLLRTDGISRGAQASGITVDDSNNMYNVASLGFDLSSETAVGEGFLVWNSDEGTLDLGMPNGVVQQIGMEQFFPIKNQSGGELLDGRPVMFAGALGASGKILVQYAIADGSLQPNYIMGLLTHSVLDGEDGYVASFGKVRGIDTTGIPFGEVWNEGDLIYVSPTTAGDLTNVPPNAPNLEISVAAVINVHANNGTLFVRPTWRGSLHSLDDVNGTVPLNNYALIYNESNEYWDPQPISANIVTYNNGSSGLVANTVQDAIDEAYAEELFWRNFYNGTINETFDAVVTSSGGVVTMSLEQSGGGDLTMRFSDGETVLDCTPPKTIDLTVGTGPVPIENFIYILKSTKVLTKSTTGWPSAEHIKVSYFLCQSAADVLEHGGTFINQNWNDHIYQEGGNSMGHLSHITSWIRRNHASYFSGIDPAGVDSYLTITAGDVRFKSAAGVVSQMHLHQFTAKDTSIDVAYVVNWFGDNYHPLHNLHDIVDDSTGTTIGNNKWFPLVFWGVANKGGTNDPIMVNLPSGSYNSQSAAEADLSGYAEYSIPDNFVNQSSTGFLISKVVVKMSGTWSFGSWVDLRGRTPQTVTGGTAGSEINDLTAVVTWANVPDVNITESSVVQHQEALTITESQISDLNHFAPSNLLTDYGFTDNSTNWDLAFGWGDHSIVGYLESVPNLQAVTNEGNSTTLAIDALEYIIAGSGINKLAATGTIVTLTGAGGVWLIDGGGGGHIKINSTDIILNSEDGSTVNDAIIRTANLTESTIFNFPEKAGVAQTFAMLSDLVGGGDNFYLTALGFVTGTGILTGTVTGASNPTVDLNGRWSLLGHSHEIADITDFTDNSTNWDLAFGWGDHSIVGYLESVPDLQAVTDAGAITTNIMTVPRIDFGDATSRIFSSTISALNIADTVNGLIFSGPSGATILVQGGGIKIDSHNNGGSPALLKTTNITTQKTFEFPDVSGTFALTSDLSGLGTMSSWDLEADTGTPRTITDGNAVSFQGDTGAISTLVSNGNILTIAHKETTGYKHIPSGGVANQFLKWTADGDAVWAAITAGGTMSTWDLDGDSGPTQVISDNDTVTIQGDSGAITTLALNGEAIEIQHILTTGFKHIPSGGSADQFLKYSASGTAIWSDLPAGGYSFFISEGGGTPHEILNGETVDFVGNVGLAALHTGNEIRFTIEYIGINNMIVSAASEEGNTIDLVDKILFHDITSGNVKRGLVSDLPFAAAIHSHGTLSTGAGLSGNSYDGSSSPQPWTIEYTGATNVINSAPTLNTPAAGDYIIYHDVTDGNVKKALVSSLPSGGGGMTNFIMNGDSGLPQTISDGNTLLIVGNFGIKTVATITDTLSININYTDDPKNIIRSAPSIGTISGADQILISSEDDGTVYCSDASNLPFSSYKELDVTTEFNAGSDVNFTGFDKTKPIHFILRYDYTGATVGYVDMHIEEFTTGFSFRRNYANRIYLFNGRQFNFEFSGIIAIDGVKFNHGSKPATATINKALMYQNI